MPKIVLLRSSPFPRLTIGSTSTRINSHSRPAFSLKWRKIQGHHNAPVFIVVLFFAILFCRRCLLAKLGQNFFPALRLASKSVRDYHIGMSSPFGNEIEESLARKNPTAFNGAFGFFKRLSALLATERQLGASNGN